ncbi:TetR/AcrR family transcriptional regulator [Glycomyces tenuis]|uniref:TetR/AcrR family transcriptional regulator n=1 Tax=Glycomyces tenuis TaxID=58116 RepID=UPI00054F2E76|nr:TetR/AcrR family transcriptional regulator [Glycomyces tenuis]
MSPRARHVADAALDLLAERGMRGLTHRAVDEIAGLPLGSTSNVARSRVALLELALTRLEAIETERFTSAGPFPEDPDALAALLAAALTDLIGRHRSLSLARYEMALEANRQPALRRRYDQLGRRPRELATAAMAAAGSPDPPRHGRTLLAFVEGLTFDALAGAGDAPSAEELHSALRGLLRGMLGR